MQMTRPLSNHSYTTTDLLWVQLLTLQLGPVQLCSCHASDPRQSSWSNLPLTALLVFVCLTGCHRFPRSPNQICKMSKFTLSDKCCHRHRTQQIFCKYSRSITLSMGQVFHQDIQTFVLLIKKFLSPPEEKKYKLHCQIKYINMQHVVNVAQQGFVKFSTSCSTESRVL